MGTPGNADGRFAPSPTGDLHLGNLRTALLAWLFARSAGAHFRLRLEDLDVERVRPGSAERQLADLAALGLDWDGEVVVQSERAGHHAAALRALEGAGRTYECFCSRREIREAASAPHGPGPDGSYPGTCRDLSVAERAARHAGGRRPALRLRADGQRVAFQDRQLGPQEGVVDDFVVRRADGVIAYNLAVVVDDAAQAIGEVVRGADLLDTTPRQILLGRLLGLPIPAYAHVPLVLGPDGDRLAKRHGAVTLPEVGAREALEWMARSLGMTPAGSARELLGRGFDPDALSREPARWP
jgi:glutamyl-tRNA synthetase